MKNKKPKLTIISPSFNTGEFLKETIDSIVNQSYSNFEYIIIDGGSTDETLNILKEYSQKYSQIKWISKKDRGYLEAFRKGVNIAQGDYIMNCSISDGYLDKHWFQRCIDVLNDDNEVSLVWGLQQYKNEDGSLGDIIYSRFCKLMPPQKTDFIYYWLSIFFVLPEQNFCVRKEILNKCFPQDDNLEDKNRNTDPWLEFIYNFNTRGYVPYFIQTIANFARFHEGQRTAQEQKSGIVYSRYRNYTNKIRDYEKKLISRAIIHQYRNCKKEILPYKFSILKFMIKYKLAPINILAHLSRAGYFDYIKKRLPGIYQVSRKAFHGKSL
jgi:glycosyltransferase involved in cell wall biosynthesis